jgi:hypothetical protein
MPSYPLPLNGAQPRLGVQRPSVLEDPPMQAALRDVNLLQSSGPAENAPLIDSMALCFMQVQYFRHFGAV